MSGWQRVGAGLRSPITLLIAVVAAIAFGLLAPAWALQLAPLGDAYLAMFQVVLLPFLLAAMLSSVARLIRTPAAKAYIRGLLIVYPVGLLLAAAVGVLAAGLLQPGAAGHHGEGNALGQIIDSTPSSYATDLEVTLAEPVASAAPKAGAWAGLIPSNIFAALNAGETLKVLVFGVLFGLALGRTPTTRGDVLDMLEGIYATCQTFVRWLTMALPIGLFAMLSAQVAKSGLEALVAMGGFVITQAAGAVALAAVAVLVVAWKARSSLRDTVEALGPTMLLAISTRSSMACIPTAIEALVDRLRQPRLGMELLLPLGTTVFRFGPALYYAVGTLFIAQLYGRPLGWTEMALVIGLSAFAAVASSGASGPLTLAMVSLVCVPLRLPYEAALVLFIAVDALLDPLRTLGIVVGNCAAASWLEAGRRSAQPGAPPEAAGAAEGSAASTRP